jgi:tRNA modification GTPase
VLIDTAGIHESADPVERLGVERSRQALRGADLALLVLDASHQLTPGDRAIAALTVDKPTIVVWNKADRGTFSEGLAAPPHLSAITTSATTGAGIAELAQAITDALLGGAPPAAGEARLVSSPRHRDALARAVSYLQAAALSWDEGRPADLLAGDLTVALNALGEITGETVGDDLLDLIFSRFCIGK